MALGRVAVAAALVVVLSVGWAGAAGPYSWQQPHAKVLPQGDLEWTPTPFEPAKGPQVRYIDYDAGDDQADGTTPQTAWKHHPWDRQATDKAAAFEGIATYVFKRGRGDRADRQGRRGDPVQARRQERLSA